MKQCRDFHTLKKCYQIIGGVLGQLLCICVVASALTITDVEQSTQGERLVLDAGYDQELFVGTLLEVFREQAVGTTEGGRTRNAFVGKLIISESSPDWAISKPVGIPVSPFAVGQQVRVKTRNSVRYVAGSQTNVLIDLTIETAQHLQKGDQLQVLRPMQVNHPVTQELIQWLDAIAQVRIVHVTPHRFTARGQLDPRIKPVLAGDVVVVPEPPPTGIHILKIESDGWYLSRFPDVEPGATGILSTAMAGQGLSIPFRIHAIHDHLIHIHATPQGILQVGDSVEITLDEEDTQ